MSTRRASQSSTDRSIQNRQGTQNYSYNKAYLIPAAATSSAAAWVPSTHYKSHLIIPLLWPCSFSCWETDTAGMKLIIFFGILSSYTCRSLGTWFPVFFYSADGIQGNPLLCARLCIYAGASIWLFKVTRKGCLQQDTTHLGDRGHQDLWSVLLDATYFIPRDDLVSSPMPNHMDSTVSQHQRLSKISQNNMGCIR